MIVALRQLRMTAAEIAETLAMPLSTVSVVLKRNGVGRLGRIGLEQPVRYERQRHVESRPHRHVKLGRIEGGRRKTRRRTDAGPLPATQPRCGRQGARDDWLGVRPRRRRRPLTPRLCRGSCPRESGNRDRTSSAALSPTTARHGITVERVLTNNGSAYVSAVHAICCRTLGIRPPPHPATQTTNQRQSRRFIRTLQNGWAYGAIYRSSHEHTRSP